MSVYEIITNKIIESLEKGVIPWHKPWIGAGIPKNFVTKKPYRGINPFILSLYDFSCEYWLTMKQINALSGRVRKGEKSALVVFWKWINIKEENSSGETAIKEIPFLRYYHVFNIEQTEGIEWKKDLPQPRQIDNLEHCEDIFANMSNKPKIEQNKAKACYLPPADCIYMPAKESFFSAEGYYATLYHELIHSTGHASRLNRPEIVGSVSFGDEPYGKEELVAELGAAFLCGYAQIETAVIENSAAYIQSWLKVLKNDARLVIHAAAKAQRAADYILNRTEIEKNED